MKQLECAYNFNCNNCANYKQQSSISNMKERSEFNCKNERVESVTDIARDQVVKYCSNYKEHPSIKELIEDLPNKDYRKLHQYEAIDDDPEHLEKIKNTFEIIKNKKVNVGILRDYISRDEELRLGALGTYNLLIDQSLQLTEEEFNLLKEMLLERSF